LKIGSKLWAGRFTSEMDNLMLDFTHSTETDSRLIPYDIWGSQVHALMLSHQNIINSTDLSPILIWLERALSDFHEGRFVLDPTKEDVHMNVESYVIEGAGVEFGGKLHTARSRNDQVLTDTRLYSREQILIICSNLVVLCKAFIGIATKHTTTVMPGYTHTQHAQPISLGFWATAYISMFLRDFKRLFSAFETTNTNPLGAGALSGTNLPIDRTFTTELLGFQSTHQHALDVISSRDFIAETLSALAILMTNLSRFSEEIVYWTTYEFGLIQLDDSFASGSSIMPQKKNADVAELTRGRFSQVLGALVDLLSNLKSLPLGYNRDLQEDKPPLWRSFDTVTACLKILPKMSQTLTFNTDRMAQLCQANFSTATELANYLVQEKGIPFRQCHDIVGNVVGQLVKSNQTFDNLDRTASLLAEMSIEISISDLASILAPREALLRNKSSGGTSPKEVKAMIEEFEHQLENIEASIRSRTEQIELAYERTQKMVKSTIQNPPV